MHFKKRPLKREQFCWVSGHSFALANAVPLLPFNQNQPPLQLFVKQLIQQWQHALPWVVHTSGSTGTPKKIVLQQEALVQSARATLNYFCFKSGTVFFCPLPLNKIGGLMVLARALVGNHSVAITEPSSSPFKDLPTDVKVTVASMVPLQVANSIGEKGTIHRLEQLEVLLIGGAPIQPWLETEIQKLNHVKVYQTYGMTETLSHVAVKLLNGPKPDKYFHALPGIHFLPDTRDCLTVYGSAAGEPVNTTDVVKLIDAKRFKWLGRADNAINSGGIKLFPEVLERELAPHLLSFLSDLSLPNIDYALSAVPDNLLGEALVLVLQTAPLPVDTEEQLLSFLADRVSGIKKPKAIKYVAELPKRNEKLYRPGLKQLLL
jgi:O-succinylbenzoic acid--CoA ligase